MAKIKVNGIEMAYHVQGSGDPLVLICGYTGVKESWGYQVDDLARHFKVVTFDNRGVGETTVLTEPFTIADMAADTAGLIDALGIAPANVLVSPWGGLSPKPWHWIFQTASGKSLWDARVMAENMPFSPNRMSWPDWQNPVIRPSHPKNP